MGIYVFSRNGGPLLAAPSGERLPIEPAQVEGILALAGGFENDGHHGSPEESITRVRYDDYRVLGLRGERMVVASVSRDATDAVLVPELQRFLKRCEKRLQRQDMD